MDRDKFIEQFVKHDLKIRTYGRIHHIWVVMGSSPKDEGGAALRQQIIAFISARLYNSLNKY